MVVQKWRFNWSKEAQEVVNILKKIRHLDLNKTFIWMLKWIVWLWSWCAIDEYSKDLNTFTKEEWEILAEAFWKLVEIQEQNPLYDYLGEIYEGYITFGEHWQFFTPSHITEFISILVWQWDNNQVVKDWEYEKILDPACWSWKMFLGYAKKYPEKIKKTMFVWKDLDERCALITTINLWLNWLYGIVMLWNWLTDEYTKKFIINGPWNMWKIIMIA